MKRTGMGYSTGYFFRPCIHVWGRLVTASEATVVGELRRSGDGGLRTGRKRHCIQKTHSLFDVSV